MPRSVNHVASKARRKKILGLTKGYFGARKNVLCNDEIPPRYQFMLPEQPAAADLPPKCIIAVDVADAKLLGSRIQEQ